jgi:tetratricopeptide (TPR) repeat protein
LRALGELYLSMAVDGPGDSGTPSLRQKQAEMAIIWLRRALERHNKDQESWYMLGRAHEAFATASEDPDRTVHRQHAFGAYAHALDQARDEGNRGRILVGGASTCRRIDLSLSLSQCSLGVLYCSASHFDHAREAFQKALDCDERQLRAYLNLGQLYDFHFSEKAQTDEERHECKEKAIFNYKRVLRLDSSNEQARGRLLALGVPDERKAETLSLATSESAPFDEDEVSFHYSAKPSTSDFKTAF